MTVAANQRCCSQIWVVVEVIAEIAAEVLAEVAGGERVGVVDACWRYRRVLAWFSTWQICKVADGVRIVCSGERAGVIGALLDVVFDVAEPLGLWQSVENVGIACWQNFKSLVELKLL